MAKNASTRLTRQEGRRFGLTLAAGFTLLSLLAEWRGRHSVSDITAGIALICVFLACVIPDRLGPLESAWEKLGLALSHITSPVFLGVMYFVVLTPVAWTRRMLGKDSLNRSPEKGSYWITRAQVDPERRRRGMERQF